MQLGYILGHARNCWTITSNSEILYERVILRRRALTATFGASGDYLRCVWYTGVWRLIIQSLSSLICEKHPFRINYALKLPCKVLLTPWNNGTWSFCSEIRLSINDMTLQITAQSLIWGEEQFKLHRIYNLFVRCLSSLCSNHWNFVFVLNTSKILKRELSWCYSCIMPAPAEIVSYKPTSEAENGTTAHVDLQREGKSLCYWTLLFLTNTRIP